MNEKALLFGKTKSLAGVVTDPTRRPDDRDPPLGFVILNAGIVHHVGPNRIHVKLARRLAEAGFVAMRFDFSGIGDSKPRLDGKPFTASATEEIREALDYLESSRGLRSFVLVGICSGADNALRAGASDPRVEGAVAIEAHAVNTTSYLLRLYRGRLLRPRSWLRLFSGKSELWTEIFRFSRKPRPSGAMKVREESLVPGTREIVASLRSFEARGARLLLVYSVGSQSHCFYLTHLRRRIGPLRKKGSVSTRFVSGADHVFTNAATQDQLLSAIGDWVRELRAAGESPVKAAETRDSGRLAPAGS